MVAKLFAKHIKLQDSIDLCASTRYADLPVSFPSGANNGVRIGFGVGTPGRILHLIKEGQWSFRYQEKEYAEANDGGCADVLKVSHLKHIVVDASRVDKKNFGVFDIRETQGSIMDILGQRGVKERLGRDTRVLFY